MKKKISALLAAMMLMLVGCSSSNPLEEVYKDLDAEETYEAMVDYFNEKVNYYKQTSSTKSKYSESSGEAEYLVKDDIYYGISWYYDEDGDFSSGYITDEDEYYNLYQGGDDYVYFNEDIDRDEDDEDDVKIMSNLLEDDYYTVTDATCKDKNDKIILTLEVETSYGSRYEYEYTIGEDGLPTKYVMKSYLYEDDDKPFITVTYKLSDFNKKSKLDMEAAIEEIEEYADDLV
ncbi:MAG: hypothetical protein ACK5LC_03080 [Coprobacillaceae bacterium]